MLKCQEKISGWVSQNGEDTPGKIEKVFDGLFFSPATIFCCPRRD
jgi:hypothetical protein